MELRVKQQTGVIHTFTSEEQKLKLSTVHQDYISDQGQLNAQFRN